MIAVDERDLRRIRQIIRESAVVHASISGPITRSSPRQGARRAIAPLAPEQYRALYILVSKYEH